MMTLAVNLWVFAGNILDHLDTACTLQSSGIPGVDAAFLIRLNGEKEPQLLNKELRSHGLTVFEYNKFSKLTHSIMASYCSRDVVNVHLPPSSAGEKLK